MTSFRRLGSLLAGALLVLTIGGCRADAISTTPPQVSPPAPGLVPDGDMDLAAGNYTDRALVLFVNGESLGELGAHSERHLRAAELPALPWHAEVRLPEGRKLSEATVASGSVERHGTGGNGVGARVDLSCGRIDIWSGFPMVGPVPGAGT